MTRDHAIALLDGVYWAYSEGQAEEDLLEAARVLIREFDLQPDETPVAFIGQLWPASNQ